MTLNLYSNLPYANDVSLTEIRNIERQRTNASLDTVDLLADALEISPIELLK